MRCCSRWAYVNEKLSMKTLKKQGLNVERDLRFSSVIFLCFDTLSITDQLPYSAYRWQLYISAKHTKTRLYSKWRRTQYERLLLSSSPCCSERNWIQTSVQTKENILYFLQQLSTEIHRCAHSFTTQKSSHFKDNGFINRRKTVCIFTKHNLHH